MSLGIQGFNGNQGLFVSFELFEINYTNIINTTEIEIMSSYRDPQGRDNRGSRREPKLSRHCG